MRKCILLVLGAIVFLIAYTIVVQLLFERLKLAHYQLAYVFEAALPREYVRYVEIHVEADALATPGAVVFIGDSILATLPVHTLASNAINFSIGGDTTTGVLYRIPRYSSIQQAKAIVLSVGINDIGKNSNANIIQRYQQILALLPPHIPIVFNCVLPIDQRVFTARDNGRIRSLNQMIQAMPRGNRRLVIVDCYDDLLDASGNLNPAYHTGDGLHLNPEGQQVLCAALRLALAEISL
jgi:lysophospholipase L1-like esterase